MKVSVAVPTFEYYGRGVEVLDDMLRTISYQSLKDVEVVVSDHSVNDDIESYSHAFYVIEFTFVNVKNLSIWNVQN